MTDDVGTISLIPLNGIPEVRENDNIPELISAALAEQSLTLREGDILVLAQKIVSKAEGRIVDLKKVEPSPFAMTLSKEISKDPRMIEVILSETKKIIKMDQRKPEKGRLIVETRGGIISANAGVDASNVSGGDRVTLLPVDSDRSASEISAGLIDLLGIDIAVIITDTVGRPWREGLVDIAIGCSGLMPLKDYRGQVDARGFELHATEMAVADSIAASAGLVMEKTGAVPGVIVRGYKYDRGEGKARDLIRDPEDDLFR